MEAMKTNVIDQRTPAMKAEQAKAAKEYKIGDLVKKPKPRDESIYTIGSLYNSALGNPFKKGIK